MDTLPTELYEHIFIIACSDEDGGATARSLSLVSKHIHAHAKPFQFLSIKVEGAHNILALARRLTRIPISLRSIRSLHLSYRTDIAPIAPSEPTISQKISGIFSYLIHGAEHDSSMDREQWESEYNTWKTNHYAVWGAIYSILLIVAPTLETLHIQHPYHSSAIEKLVPFQSIADFPKIHTLKLNAAAPEWEGWLTPVLGQYRARNPSLRVLDIGDFRHSNGPIGNPLRFYRNIADFAPKVTHLRLNFMETLLLQEALGHDGEFLNPQDRLPGTVVCVLIQIGDIFDCSASDTCSDLTPCYNCLCRGLIVRARSLAEIDNRVHIVELEEQGMTLEELIRVKQGTFVEWEELEMIIMEELGKCGV